MPEPRPYPLARYTAPDGSASTRPGLPWWRSSAMWSSVAQIAAGAVLGGAVAKGWISPDQAGQIDIPALVGGDESAVTLALGLLVNGLIGARGRINKGAQPSPIKPLLGG